MMCRGCHANLGRINDAGEPVIRARALVLKAQGVALVCPKCSADVPVEGEMRKALGERLMTPNKPVLFLKSAVQGYTRKDGTQVRPYQNTRVRREEAATPTRPHVTEWKVGQHPEAAGAPPEGAHGVVAYNMGRGHEYVWTKRGRHGEGVWNGKEWDHGTEAHYQARRQHAQKHGTWEPNEQAHDHWESQPAPRAGG